MATVTGLTAARMQEIIDATIVDASIVGDNLILELYDSSTIDAGDVRGPQGVAGATFTICTSGTRPSGLGSPDEGLAIYETDTNLVRIWTGTRWRLQERVVCTSSTRPASLVTADEGVRIYETDTNTEYVWTGSAWVLADFYLSFASASARSSLITSPTEGMTSYLRDVDALEIYAGTAWRKPWNMPWGEVGYTEITADNTGIGLTAVDLLSVTFTAVAGRKLKITGSAQFSHVGGDGTATLYCRTAANAIIQQRGMYVAGNGYAFSLEFIKRYTPSAGSVTLKLSANTSTNTCDVQASSGRPTFMLIEDMGPSGSAT